MRSVVAAIACALAVCWGPSIRAADSQPPPPTLTPRTAAQFDITGYWVSVVTEDWTVRMVAPPKGSPGSIPVDKAAWDIAMAWDPHKDAAAGHQCKAYGGAGILRRPGRLHISWQNDHTLQIDFDAGTQTRLFRFANFLPPSGFASFELPHTLTRFQAPEVTPSLQGYTVAAWNKVSQARGFARFGAVGLPAPKPAEGGTLVALTTRMVPGYLQSNGIPYGEDAMLIEYFNRLTLPNGDAWLVVTSVVEDPRYLREPYVTSTHFKREPDSSRWNARPCHVPEPANMTR